MGQLRRLFLGVPLDEDVRAMLAQHLQQHPFPGRPVPAANWHLTIRFLGNIGQIAMERLIADLDQADMGEKFEVVVGEMGAFPRATRAAVVWLALAKGRERLTELNELAEIAYVYGAKSGFWRRLQKAAKNMELPEKVDEYERAFHDALSRKV